MATKTELVGATRLKATLAVASAQLGHLDQATRDTARLIQQRASGRAPKRTGRLAGSLTTETTGDMARVKSGLPYAGVIHYGWPAHGISAHPFLVPVAEATTPVWKRYYAANVERVLSHVKGM